MNPDPEAGNAASKLLTATFFTVVFTACHTHQNKTTTAVNHIQNTLPDSSKKTTVKPVAKKKKKTIYLTFDDGPNKGTENVMRILNEEQVPVTFFVIGEHVYGSKKQTAMFDSLVNDKLFEVANHSFTHAFHNNYNKFYAVPDSVVKDFIRCADSLHLTTNIIRTPGRNIWRTQNINSTDIKQSTAAADTLQNRSFTAVGWDLEWQFDNKLNLKANSDEMLRRIDSAFAKGKTKTANNLVLLAHDQVYATATDSFELHQLIKKLKASDQYDFETVSKYPALKANGEVEELKINH